ncbi:MAG: hypothetical protein LC798_13445 [Chloroflexi bacterium]|nr:hypothetical protein [Chloroflexota bacterium]
MKTDPTLRVEVSVEFLELVAVSVLVGIAIEERPYDPVLAEIYERLEAIINRSVVA